MEFIVLSLNGGNEVLIRPEEIAALHKRLEQTAIYLKGKESAILVNESVDFILKTLKSKRIDY